MDSRGELDPIAGFGDGPHVGKAADVDRALDDDAQQAGHHY